MRILHAVLLRRDLYESVAADPLGGSQAAAVVVVSAVAQPNGLTDVLGAWAFVVAILFGLARWAIFTVLVWPIARLITAGPVELRRLWRCLGFAEAPALLNLLSTMIDPWLRPWLGAAASVWILLATIVAVRAACKVTIGRAIAIGIISFFIYLALGVASAVFIEMSPP